MKWIRWWLRGILLPALSVCVTLAAMFEQNVWVYGLATAGLVVFVAIPIYIGRALGK